MLGLSSQRSQLAIGTTSLEPPRNNIRAHEVTMQLLTIHIYDCRYNDFRLATQETIAVEGADGLFEGIEVCRRNCKNHDGKPIYCGVLTCGVCKERAALDPAWKAERLGSSDPLQRAIDERAGSPPRSCA